jgi:hypothetical protein
VMRRGGQCCGQQRGSQAKDPWVSIAHDAFPRFARRPIV